MTGTLGAAVALGVVDQAPAAAATAADQLPSRADVISAMTLVNDYWIKGNTNPGTNQWAPATYHCGNMAHYRLTRTQKYLNYTVAWGKQNNHGIDGGTTTRNADSQCAGQVYLDLYQEHGRLEPRSGTFATSSKSYWTTGSPPRRPPATRLRPRRRPPVVHRWRGARVTRPSWRW
ncbi:glycoside hydrolase family 88 protein [Kitasatospora sp. NBC_00240]|uniref:glycoside hydrolase family 88 protein n=1 Tax=Kitasatospora sp. NBC_00240 TaxID=2903567 RepID=UPI00225034D3|nr:glycoside hydrolase family 88 protein [Kitasatospora sp. NBC_00240]MCX5208441.1 glycoside hydrolase family 88 protein [Kitasatospora sp. NBC_00240]